VAARGRVLLVPGGGSSVHGYFPELAVSLAGDADVIEADPPGLDVAAGRRWLRVADGAGWLADAVRREGDGGRVVVVAHSLGGLFALRLALDHPRLVGGLLLLDPSPLMPAMLLPATPLRVVELGGRLRLPRRGAPRRPRAVSIGRRLLWYVGLDGIRLAAALAAGRLHGIPTVVVSAGEHDAGSTTRRTHERLVGWIPGAELQVWNGTTHPLHLQQPARVVELARALLAARSDL